MSFKENKSNSSLTCGEDEMVTVSLGSVIVRAKPPTEQTRRINIEAGQAALKRAKSALIKVGIKLPREAGVPLYFGCDNQPGLMIQELDGHRSLGKFVRGRFCTIKAS